MTESNKGPATPGTAARCEELERALRETERMALEAWDSTDPIIYEKDWGSDNPSDAFKTLSYCLKEIWNTARAALRVGGAVKNPSAQHISVSSLEPGRTTAATLTVPPPPSRESAEAPPNTGRPACGKTGRVETAAGPAEPAKEAIPEIERLKAENASLPESLLEAREGARNFEHNMMLALAQRNEANDALAAAEQRAEAAEKALREARRLFYLYGQHYPGCPKSPGGHGQCTCAYEEARAALHDEERSAPRLATSAAEPPQEKEEAGWAKALRKYAAAAQGEEK